MEYRCTERDIMISTKDAFWLDMLDVMAVHIELERTELEKIDANDTAKIATSQGMIKALRLCAALPESMVLELREKTETEEGVE